MSLAINEISFNGYCLDEYHGRAAIDNFISVIKELCGHYDIRIQDIYGGRIDVAFAISEGINFSRLLNTIGDCDKKRILLSVIHNTRNYEPDELDMLRYGDMTAYGATYALHENGVIVSLASDDAFKGDYVEFRHHNGREQINNVAYINQILIHAEHIIVRFYVPNPKHGSRVYYRNGGRMVSDMPLSDDMAQHLLNTAIIYKNRLFNVYDNDYYEFPKTQKNIYHGFRRTDLSDDDKMGIKRIIEEHSTNG